MNYNPEILHDKLYGEMTAALAFNECSNFEEWREKIRSVFLSLLKMPEKNVSPTPIVEYEKHHDGFTETRFTFESEAGYFVPCHLLVPDSGKAKYPVMVCLQGHSTGMHISLGVAKYDGDDKSIEGDRDFALIAVKKGYAALVMEQRCFGECVGYKRGNRCAQSAMQALMLGRTLIGERVFDISRAIDTLPSFEKLDCDKIVCMGNSGGGTATYYATCVDERIKAAMPSCAFCTYKDSIFDISHCSCNHIPDALKFFEMQDLACLIAPKPLVIVSGRYDNIFPLVNAEAAFETVKKIYAASGSPDNCRMVIGEGGHRFYSDIGYKALGEIYKI